MGQVRFLWGLEAGREHGRCGQRLPPARLCPCPRCPAGVRASGATWGSALCDVAAERVRGCVRVAWRSREASPVAGDWVSLGVVRCAEASPLESVLPGRLATCAHSGLCVTCPPFLLRRAAVCS